jgi:hypothetical protein
VTHCDLASPKTGVLKAVFWKGYATTGCEITRLPVADWSAWKSFRFDVENPYREPFSVYVRISGRADHPASETYTGGTFDGFVIGPGLSTVEISLEKMQSPDEKPVDPRRVHTGFSNRCSSATVDLKFTEDKIRVAESWLRRSRHAQKQPYGDLPFRRPTQALRARQEAERGP